MATTLSLSESFSLEVFLDFSGFLASSASAHESTHDAERSRRGEEGEEEHADPGKAENGGRERQI